MIESLLDELYQLENEQKKGVNFVLTLCRRWRGENAPKFSSQYLKDRICRIKQYLNYVLMIINQNILGILRTFLNLQKSLGKNLHQENFQSCYY